MGRVYFDRNREGYEYMMTAELAKKIDTLSGEEYHMVEVYVDTVMEYSRRRKKEASWDRIKSDLDASEKRMERECGIHSSQLREDFAGALFGIVTTTQKTMDYWKE